MKKYKVGISLIVLVITVIVLSILAVTVIISLNNTNIIGKTHSSVDNYNLKQMEAIVNSEFASMMLDNNGKIPDTFELIEGLHSREIITDRQKNELLTNGGELAIGGETLKLDTSKVIYSTGIELVPGETENSIRFKFALNKYPELNGIEYNEFGCIVLPEKLFDRYYPEISIEKKFKLGANEKYGMPIGVSKAQNFFEDDAIYGWNTKMTGIIESRYSRVYCVRAYVKYTYNGIDGVMYSDIVSASVDSLK